MVRGRGYEVVVGECLDGAGLTSAPPADRASELSAMLVDPSIAAVVPPWGGALAVEIRLDAGTPGALEQSLV